MTPTIELICGHRSIRHFTDEPISEAQCEAIINSARATSSSSFLQCSSIIRITDKALREELVTLTGGQKHVAQAAEFWVFCADFNRHDGAECINRSGIAGIGRGIYRRPAQ